MFLGRGGGLGNRKTTITGAVVWLFAVVLFIFDVLGAVDFIVERTKDFGWLGDVIDAVIDPPRSLTLAAFLLGPVLVYIGLKLGRTIGEPEQSEDAPRVGEVTQIEDWRKVDPIRLWQAGCLWREISPVYPVTFTNPAYSTFSMLMTAVENRQLKTVKRFTIKDLAFALVSREELKRFAALKGDSPAFLSESKSDLALRAPPKGRLYALIAVVALSIAANVAWDAYEYQSDLACTPKFEWHNETESGWDDRATLKVPTLSRFAVITPRSERPYKIQIDALGDAKDFRIGKRDSDADPRDTKWEGSKAGGHIAILLHNPKGAVEFVISARNPESIKLIPVFSCLK